MYRIGQLDRRVNIERDIRTPDGMGGQIVETTIVCSAWAMYRNKSTRELLQGQQLQSTAVGVFVLRNRNDLLPTDRIRMGDVRFNIVGIPPYDSRESFIEISVEAGVAV